MAQKEVKQWITVNGKHVPIFEGESKADAVKRVLGKGGDKKEPADVSASKAMVSKEAAEGLKKLKEKYAKKTGGNKGDTSLKAKDIGQQKTVDYNDLDMSPEEFKKEAEKQGWKVLGEGGHSVSLKKDHWTSQEMRDQGMIVDYKIPDNPKEKKKRIAREIADENDAYDRTHGEGKYSKTQKQIADNAKKIQENKQAYKKLDEPYEVTVERRGEKVSMKSYGEGWEEGYHVEHTDYVGGKFIDKGKVGDYEIGESVNYLNGSKMQPGTIVMAHKYPNGKVEYTVKDKDGDGHSMPSKSLAKTDANRFKQNSQISKDFDTKEKQIAQHKAEADKLNGKTSTKQHHRDKNVSDTLEALGWTGDNKPTFIDKMTHGYRIGTGTKDEQEARALAKQIKDKSGVEVDLRKRSGYGSKAGKWDIIVPFAGQEKKDNKQTKIDDYNEKVLNRRYEERQKFSKAGDGSFIVDFDEIGGTMNSFKDMAKRKGFEVVRSDGESVTLRKSSGLIKSSVADLRKQALAAGYSKEKIQGMSAQALKKLLQG